MMLLENPAILNHPPIRFDFGQDLTRVKRDRAAGLLLSVVFHVFVLFVGGAFALRSAEYGIELSQGGMDLYLVAALPQEVSQGSSKIITQTPLPQLETEMTFPKLPETADGAQAAELKKEFKAGVKNAENYGDGSSEIPGIHSTTFYSEAGATTDGKAGHLRNPAPPYPKTSIELGQEGVVLLAVHVDRTGRATKVELKESSGFRLLDQSAVNTVKKWKFDPARLGFLAAESMIHIPIRFELEDKQKRMLS